MTTHPLCQFRNNGETAELFIYGVIGDDFGGITSKEVANELKAAKKASEIVVHINSVGGSVFESHAIYAQLTSHKAKKSVTVDGVAASGGSVIAMAGDSITMAKAASMMIHEAWNITIGTADDMRKTAAILDQLNGQLVELYAARTGQKEDKVRQMLADETWMTADQALELGFATDINQHADRMAAFIDPDGLKCKKDKAEGRMKYKFIPEEFVKPLAPLEQLAVIQAQIKLEKRKDLGIAS